ncbi:9653_t:CDS:2, partial [Scutellospora calospora]
MKFDSSQPKKFSSTRITTAETGTSRAQYLYLDIFDIIGLSWSNSSLLNTPTARDG